MAFRFSADEQGPFPLVLLSRGNGLTVRLLDGLTCDLTAGVAPGVVFKV